MSNVFQLNQEQYELGIRDAQNATDTRTMAALFVTASHNPTDSYWIGVADTLRPRLNSSQINPHEHITERLERVDTDRAEYDEFDETWESMNPSDDDLDSLDYGWDDFAEFDD